MQLTQPLPNRPHEAVGLSDDTEGRWFVSMATSGNGLSSKRLVLGRPQLMRRSVRLTACYGPEGQGHERYRAS